jgi:membrane protein YdbS with pleckstrin-like domain
MAEVYWGSTPEIPVSALSDGRAARPATARPYSRRVPGLFSPPADLWIKISPKYVVVRVLGAIIANALFWIPVSLVWAWVFEPGHGALNGVPMLTPYATAVQWFPAAVGIVWFVWRVYRAGRYAHSWSYAERGEDLCITRGLWYKNLTIVPYGRLQIAKVDAGPLDRLLGLATVTLVTASAHSNASIPGLPAAEAERLRDRLIEVGDSLGSGL